ncbi:OadG family protein [Pseudomonas sp. S9]|uniref:OadG family protein n=1 Tax=Pseudomonas sp. S9 TaxID=686578 RepID=UPI0002556821|nr:OadG family protein [Pseudomonas sp. S9]
MASTNLVLEGVELMLFGMGSVFVFLTLLVLSIRIMSRLLERYTPVAAPTPASASMAVVDAAQEPAADVLEAIQAAIHQHRARRG